MSVTQPPAPAPAPDAAVDLSDLAYRWPGRAGFTLRLPGFRLEAGQRALLLGPSGGGKSTLLALIAGVARPDAGRVAVAGTDLTALSAARRDRFRAERIGVIFQQFNLLPYATPLDNILLPLAFAPLRRARLGPAPARRAEALRLAAALGLPERLVTRAAAAELSTGQQQRVAAARALIGGPALILADEPTSALDPDARDAFLDLLAAQTAAAGAALLAVSHDEALVPRFDRVVRLPDLLATAA